LRRIYLPPQAHTLNPLQYLFTYVKKSLLGRKDIFSETDLALNLEKIMRGLNYAKTESFFNAMYKIVQNKRFETFVCRRIEKFSSKYVLK
jgi:transposase